MKCPYCGKEVEGEKCSYCYAELPKPKETTKLIEKKEEK